MGRRRYLLGAGRLFWSFRALFSFGLGFRPNQWFFVSIVISGFIDLLGLGFGPFVGLCPSGCARLLFFFFRPFGCWVSAL